MPPLNKQAQGTVGTDLIITYHSNLAQYNILPPSSHYMNTGNFKARTFLPFNQPDFVLDLYPSLLSTKDRESSVIPLLLLISNKNVPWPSSSAHMSFTSPVNLDTFHIKEDVWPEALSKTSVFIKLGSYLLPENNHPPHKGIHICHVLLIFPIKQQPWSSLLG
ncbi:hypothetical protein B0T25DRAFT_587624 [Lasiosphaeria hispida]|uniref:Uncharacterized protein n=1 Tax=Lasiosphaeria hispida TaxID=260671 RepID=A0AAJ0HW56_9PEZI|nr:hypothetical protein B0T25DRAFT_587624 [Lasiosphaeria hispida]